MVECFPNSRTDYLFGLHGNYKLIPYFVGRGQPSVLVVTQLPNPFRPSRAERASEPNFRFGSTFQILIARVTTTDFTTRRRTTQKKRDEKKKEEEPKRNARKKAQRSSSSRKRLDPDCAWHWSQRNVTNVLRVSKIQGW